MKKIILLFTIIMSASFSWSQTDVTLKINHRLNLDDFALDQAAVNNLGQSYKTTRLDYYISTFIIVHDGGTETAVPLDVIAFIQPGTEVSTLIPLGNYAITTVEKIKFSVGVYAPINNSDPALYDVDHPLGPKSPAMHWGWAAGYRFVAYEGFGGADYSQNFQLHGLGNANYFVQEQEVIAEMVGGTMVLNLDANYTEALRDINIATGIVSHGETGAALKMLENFRDFVFGNYYASIESNEVDFEWNIYPNPSNTGSITISFASLTAPYVIQITNNLGQIVSQRTVKSANQVEIEVPGTGIFNVSILSGNKVIARDQFIVI